MTNIHKPKKINKLIELEAQLKRSAADFDNYRKHAETEKKASWQTAQAVTILELAPVLDNFRRATSHLPPELEGNSWVAGVLYIEKQLEQIFEQLGVAKIKTVGEQFNPALHEAVEIVSSETIATDHIAEELESGYMLGNQVLKPAKVKVAK